MPILAAPPRQYPSQIALIKDALFHPKVWLFENGSEVVAAHGSSNMTYAGIRKYRDS